MGDNQQSLKTLLIVTLTQTIESGSEINAQSSKGQSHA